MLRNGLKIQWGIQNPTNSNAQTVNFFINYNNPPVVEVKPRNNNNDSYPLINFICNIQTITTSNFKEQGTRGYHDNSVVDNTSFSWIAFGY